MVDCPSMSSRFFDWRQCCSNAGQAGILLLSADVEGRQNRATNRPQSRWIRRDLQWKWPRYGTFEKNEEVSCVLAYWTQPVAESVACNVCRVERTNCVLLFSSHSHFVPDLFRWRGSVVVQDSLFLWFVNRWSFHVARGFAGWLSVAIQISNSHLFKIAPTH